MINWKNPEVELPPDGAYVAGMSYHQKMFWPLSAEIIFGEVESYYDENNKRKVRMCTNDFTGAGSSCLYFYPCHEEEAWAWAFASEFEKPDFIPHSSYWGDIGKYGN